MTLTIEDGTSVLNADSYTTVAEVDTYITDYTTDLVWCTKSIPEKESYIRKGTNYVDDFYRSRWRGRPTKERTLQTRAWPRRGVVLTYNNTVEINWHIGTPTETVNPTEIPLELKQACMEAAIKLANDVDLQQDANFKGEVQREKVDIIEVQYTAFSSGVKVRFPDIEDRLKPFITPRSNPRMVRG